MQEHSNKNKNFVNGYFGVRLEKRENEYSRKVKGVWN